MDKKFWIFLGLVVVVIAAIFFTTKGSNHPSSGYGQPTNHIEGKGSSGVKLVEYGDYECPYCAMYFPIVKQVVAIYSPYIYFQFRNLPLTQLHPNAFAGARAAEAAGLQGKFWQMHDLLYQNNDPSGAAGWVASTNPLNDFFIGYAKQLGLNISQFKTDFNSNAVNNSINADVAVL